MAIDHRGLQFLVEQHNLTKQFSQYIGSDSPNLHTFKGSGGKMIASYGNQDQIIPPNGHYNYMQRLFAAMGGVAKTQDFYRYYVFPNAHALRRRGHDHERVVQRVGELGRERCRA